MSSPTGYPSPFGDPAPGPHDSNTPNSDTPNSNSPASDTADATPDAAPLTRRQLRERERAATAALEVITPVEADARPRTAATEREILPRTAPVSIPAPVPVPVQQADASATPTDPLALTRRERRARETRPAATGAIERVPAVPKAPVPAKQSVRLRAVKQPARPTHPRGHAGHHPVRKRRFASLAAMLAAAGLVTTFALPAYAISTHQTTFQQTSLAGQTLSVANVVMPKDNREKYTMIENVAAWDSTLGTTVPSSVQALAAKIMSAVASGRLVGSIPDHIPEIRNLAQGVAVPGCGVDYRVLQVIEVALDNFNTVGVSDINRRCTGQIEGAGTASAHYADGGGHAVDFDMLNGQSLTGGDANSLRLIRILDPLVPPGTQVGQQECRPAIALKNLAPFDDTCDHVHIGFGGTLGASLGD